MSLKVLFCIISNEICRSSLFKEKRKWTFLKKIGAHSKGLLRPMNNINVTTRHVETVILLSQQKPDDYIDIDLAMSELDITATEKKATYQELKDYVLENTGLKVSTLYISQVKRKCGLDVGDSYNKPQSDDNKPPQWIQ